MSINERSSARKRLRWPMPGEMVLLAAVAVLLVALHILAGSLLQPAATRGSVAPLEDTRSSID